jgi:hypothetical protein
LEKRGKTLLNNKYLARFYVSLLLKNKGITMPKKSFKEYSQGQGCHFYADERGPHEEQTVKTSLQSANIYGKLILYPLR